MSDTYDYARAVLDNPRPAAANGDEYDYAGAVLGKKKPIAAPAAEPYKNDVATDYSAATGRGLRRGIASGVGFPVDAGNALLGLVGLGSEHPVGGSDFWDKVLGLGIAGDYEGERSGARVAGRAAETVGSVLGPAGAATQAARQGYRAAGAAGRYLQPMVDAAGEAPAASLATQAGVSVLPGTIAGATKELTGSDLAASAAELGSFAAGPQTLKTAIKVGSNLIRPIIKPEKQAAMDAVRRFRGAAVDPEGLKAKVEAATDYESSVPGYEPTTTELVSDPGISALAQGVAASKAQESGLFYQRRTGNNKAVRAALEEALPFLPQEQIDSLIASVQARHAELGHGAKAEDVGRVIRDELEKRVGEFTTARSEFTTPAYEKAREAAGDHDAEIARLKALKDKYEARMERYGPETKTHQKAKEALDALEIPEIDLGPVVKPLQRALGAARAPGDADGIKAIQGAFVNPITGAIDNSATGLMNTSKGLSEIAGNYNYSKYTRGVAASTKERLDRTLTEIIPGYGQESALFREGSEPINAIVGTPKATTPAGEVLQPQPRPLDGYAMEQSKVVGQFFRKGRGGGQVEAARNLKDALSDLDTRLSGESAIGGPGVGRVRFKDIAGRPLEPQPLEMRPAALKAVQDHVAELLNGYAKNGVLTADQLRKFHSDYGDALGEFPAVRDKVRNLGTAQRTLETGQAKQALIKDFHTKINNAELNDDLTNMISPVKLRKFVLDNREAIAEVAGPAQLQRIEMITREMDQAYHVSRPNPTHGSNSVDKANAGGLGTSTRSVIGTITRYLVLPPILSATGAGMGTHFGSYGGAAGGAAGTALGGGITHVYNMRLARIKQMSDDLVGRALLNPEDAKLLLSKWHGGNDKQISALLQPYLALAGTGDQLAREAGQ